MPRAIAGIFDTQIAAQATVAALVNLGLPGSRISLSTNLNEDAVAGEHPGQSFENQPGQGAERGGGRGLFGALGQAFGRLESESARYGEAVRSGVCVVRVDVESSDEGRRVGNLMRAQGARHTGEPIS